MTTNLCRLGVLVAGYAATVALTVPCVKVVCRVRYSKLDTDKSASVLLEKTKVVMDSEPLSTGSGDSGGGITERNGKPGDDTLADMGEAEPVIVMDSEPLSIGSGDSGGGITERNGKPGDDTLADTGERKPEVVMTASTVAEVDTDIVGCSQPLLQLVTVTTDVLRIVTTLVDEPAVTVEVTGQVVSVV